eukprot:CAMPEP_0206573860 /NCGR_PEP_ID=MMETSP0325_2-20121206/29087_1 /ASSEMBLY_ACC=CAM_ASM_000347 /TAXON_ID=2866 /ORGANISM="Crypthecodinium cohnii, Strain Seligo" /LENGTH=66 /DNA_ID=CAMNT_0054078325 /DNA_START=367 /DNA_END=567 /DNA_ORIENTATION=+
MCPGIRQRLDLSKVLALALELPLAVCLDIGAGVGWAKSWNSGTRASLPCFGPAGGAIPSSHARKAA